VRTNYLQCTTCALHRQRSNSTMSIFKAGSVSCQAYDYDLIDVVIMTDKVSCLRTERQTTTAERMIFTTNVNYTYIHIYIRLFVKPTQRSPMYCSVLTTLMQAPVSITSFLKNGTRVYYRHLEIPRNILSPLHALKDLTGLFFYMLCAVFRRLILKIFVMILLTLSAICVFSFILNFM